MSKSESDIYYVDYADRAFLQKVYAGNPLVDPERIVDVDFIWGERSLREITGEREFDYIVASHVIEHVPDLVTWVRELVSVLAPQGTIRLAVPDRRYTFDLLRRESSLSDVLNAHLLGARQPLPIAVLDYFMNAVAVDSTEAWEGKVDVEALRKKQRTQVDQAMRLARDAVENRNYHDAHCWVFTPRSFARLVEALCDSGYLDVACDGFSDTERYHIEFFVSLRPEGDRARAIESWRQMEAKVVPGETVPPGNDGSRPPTPGAGSYVQPIRRLLRRISRVA